MSAYFHRSPAWLRWLYPRRIWQMPTEEKKIYLTFDDGPHPDITPFVLDTLEAYQAKASFFCIGQNVDRYPDTFRLVRDRGHGVGHHTQHHVNGWSTSSAAYLQEVVDAQERVGTNWFRPPYGRLRSAQARAIWDRFPDMRIAMWTVLSGDFDGSVSGEYCARQVQRKAGPGSIIVMHDSEKAWNRLRGCLPLILEHFNEEGYSFEKFPDS